MSKPAFHTLWPLIRADLQVTMPSSNAQPLLEFVDLAVEGRAGQADSARCNGLLRLQRKTEGTDRAIGILSGLGLPMPDRVGIVSSRIKNGGAEKYGLSTTDLPSATFIERRILFLEAETASRSTTMAFLPTSSSTRG